MRIMHCQSGWNQLVLNEMLIRFSPKDMRCVGLLALFMERGTLFLNGRKLKTQYLLTLITLRIVTAFENMAYSMHFTRSIPLEDTYHGHKYGC